MLVLLRKVKVIKTGMEAGAYADWKAPKDDQAILLWPAGSEILRTAGENHRVLSTDQTAIQRIPLNELRRQMRQLIGVADAKRLVIADGHQTELYHPGVWVKLAAIDRVARQLDGEAVHFAVDSDAPKHLNLKWPGGSEGMFDASQSGADWAGLLRIISAEQLRETHGKLSKAAESWPFDSMIFDFLRLLRPGTELAGSLTEAMAEFDRRLGLSHRSVLVSPLWDSRPFLIFTHHVLARAGLFARHYNAALAEYRRIERIDSPGRPMPDLELSDDHIEAPFWLDDSSNGRRQRLHVQVDHGGTIGINISGDVFELSDGKDGDGAGEALAAFCAAHRVRLAPRALTLTMFLRMLVCDQWVHGIGGGRYDRVTDAIIRSFFGGLAPKFAVATATLYFPTAAGRSRTCLSCVKHKGHQLKHRLLGAGKDEYLRQIEAAPRRSARRSEIFADMHRGMSEVERAGGMADWERRWAEARKEAVEDREIFDRELFYALQPRDRLERLMERVKDVVFPAGVITGD